MRKNTIKIFPQIIFFVTIGLLISSLLTAFPNGWSQIVDADGTVRAYDENNELVWIAYLDANGKFKLEYQGIVQNDDDDPFGNVGILGDELNFEMGISAADVEIYDMTTGQTVWENGGDVNPGDSFSLPLGNFSIEMHMMVTLDDLGNQTNAVLFKKGSACEGSLVIK